MTSVLSALASAVLLAASGRLPDYADWKAMVRRDHPRIFFNRDQWPAIAAAAKGSAREDLDRLLARCERYTDDPVCTGTGVPGNLRGTAVDFNDTPIPDIRDWGDQAADCALAWRFTGERRYLEKAKAMLRANVRGWTEAFENRRAVSWYAHLRINSFCAYDWIREDLSPDERRALIGPLLEAVDRFTNPVGRPKIRRLDATAYGIGSYGEPTIDIYAGLSAFGDGEADELAERMLARGYATYKVIVERHLDGETEERTLGSDTPGYSLGDSPPGAYNFLHMYLAATGVNLAPRLRGFSSLPDWVWWLWIPDPDRPSRPFYPGTGDVRHDTNRLEVERLREHLLQMVHFYRESEPARARLAMSLAELCPPTSLGFNGQWPLLPFILRSDPPVRPFPLETLKAAKHKARLFRRFGHVFMRSGWEPDSTYAFIGAGADGVGAHKHYDEGGFVIYKHDFLALDTGSRAAQTDYNLRYYYPQSVAHNVTLVTKPDEPLPSAWGPRVPGHDRQRCDGGMSGKSSTLIDFRTTEAYTYVAVDLTKTYGGKCDENVRQFVHVQPDFFVVYDRVGAKEAEWTKRWLLHTQNEPVADGRGFRADSRGGRLFCETLLPEDAKLEKIGGSGREFWSGGRNWPLEESWEQARRAECARIGRGPYWGEWRMEVVPGAARKEDRFLHVLTAASTNCAHGVAARLIRKAERDGVVLTLPDGREARVEFNRTGPVAAEVTVGER